MISVFIKRVSPNIFHLFTAASTVFFTQRSIFVGAKHLENKNVCDLQTVFSAGYSYRNMATSTGGKDEPDSILVGALRKTGIKKDPKTVTDEEWARILSPDQYAILRESHTEPPFTGQYVDKKDSGNYYCAGCGTMLFSSNAKFDSHCGWPAFYAAAPVQGEKTSRDDDGSNVGRRPDKSHGMVRTEIYCKKCGSHLGHVFDDGPQPTGERHCVNSAAIEFVPNAVNKK